MPVDPDAPVPFIELGSSPNLNHIVVIGADEYIELAQLDPQTKKPVLISTILVDVKACCKEAYVYPLPKLDSYANLFPGTCIGSWARMAASGQPSGYSVAVARTRPSTTGFPPSTRMSSLMMPPRPLHGRSVTWEELLLGQDGIVGLLRKNRVAPIQYKPRRRQRRIAQALEALILRGAVSSNSSKLVWRNNYIKKLA